MKPSIFLPLPTHNLILYGIGAFCNKMMRTWRYANPELFNNISCFTDSRPETWGCLFHGKPVIPPDDLCYWNYHKIIITPEKFSDEIYSLLQKKYHIPSDRIIAYPPVGPYESLLLPNYRLYMGNNHHIDEQCVHDWFMDKAADVQVIHKAFILPLKTSNECYYGGVYHQNGKFVDGHVRGIAPRLYGLGFMRPCTVPSAARYIKETVVYAGVLFSHFGHLITESLARLWYYLSNPDCGYRFAFLTEGTCSESNVLLHMLGLTEDKVLLIDEPMQFDAVIVPEQSFFPDSGFYREHSLNVYDAIRDSVTPANYEKVYLTRSKLDMHQRLINEEYFEEHFRSLGYEVIAPEQLTVKEQIAVMAGAKHIACTDGTLSHLILFSQTGINITILCRSPHLAPAQYWINQARGAKCVMIDISMNFFDPAHISPSILLFPTIYWRRYLLDEGISMAVSENILLEFAPKIIEYITQYTTRLMEDNNFFNSGWLLEVSKNALLPYMVTLFYSEIKGDSISYATAKHRFYLQMGVDFWTSPRH